MRSLWGEGGQVRLKKTGGVDDADRCGGCLTTVGQGVGIGGGTGSAGDQGGESSSINAAAPATAGVADAATTAVGVGVQSGKACSDGHWRGGCVWYFSELYT